MNTYSGQVTPSLATGSNGFVAGNYAITYSKGNITVTTAPLTITAGNGLGAFAISNAGVITVADVTKLDFETNPTFTLTVQVTDGGTLSASNTVTINLSNVNLYNGYDYNQLLKNIAATGVDPYDPRFGKSDLFNAGFAGRFGVKYIF